MEKVTSVHYTKKVTQNEWTTKFQSSRINDMQKLHGGQDFRWVKQDAKFNHSAPGEGRQLFSLGPALLNVLLWNTLPQWKHSLLMVCCGCHSSLCPHPVALWALLRQPACTTIKVGVHKCYSLWKWSCLSSRAICHTVLPASLQEIQIRYKKPQLPKQTTCSSTVTHVCLVFPWVFSSSQHVDN